MSFLGELEEELNKVRVNPSSLVDKVEGIKTHFQGKY